MPRKYEDFSLDLKPASDEESRKSKKPLLEDDKKKKDSALQLQQKNSVNRVLDIPSEEALAHDDSDEDYLPNSEMIQNDDSDIDEEKTQNLPAISKEVVNSTPVVNKITLTSKKDPPKNTPKSTMQKPLPTLAGIAKKIEASFYVIE